MAVMVFSDDGSEIRAIVLSADSARGRTRMVRLRQPVWHTIIPLSAYAVFLETIVGPFEGNRFAPWFPGVDQPEGRNAWITKLRQLALAAADRTGHETC
jgi:hypothetical protein